MTSKAPPLPTSTLRASPLPGVQDAAIDVPKPKRRITKEVAEALNAEGFDWFSEGYMCADDYVKRWSSGAAEHPVPIDKQPQGGTANGLWRRGFNQRVREHLADVMRRKGLAAGAEAEKQLPVEVKSILPPPRGAAPAVEEE